MRELTAHKVNGCNDNLQIVTRGLPGEGGAGHSYQIINVSRQNTAPDGDEVLAELNFQNGPIAAVGTNGITNEALLAVVIDRLQGFQRGQYACRENALALTKLEEAMHWLQHRTRERLARGVEGTHQK